MLSRLTSKLLSHGLFYGVLAFFSASGWAATPEYELKAAFIARFTEFIEWPGAPNSTSPFRICIFGEHPIEEPLHKLPALIKVKSRPLQIQRIHTPDEATRCEVVFVPRDAAKMMHAVNRAVDKHPALIVGEVPGQLQQGALLNFYNEGDRLRFEINLPEAKNVGLVISSRLLKLATVVE